MDSPSSLDPDWLKSQEDTQPVPSRYPPEVPQDTQTRVEPIYEPPPADPLSTYQPIYLPGKPPPRRRPGGCGCLGGLLVILLLVVAAYFVFPARTRLLLLGLDTREDNNAVGRSDTIILMQVNPLRPDIQILSIPRDLWVFIPGVGENRINTAHFFAEANIAGSGPQAVIDTIETNFGVRPHFYARVRFSGFRDIVDAMDGLDVNLEEPAGGFEAGRHHLNGEEALAFARDRQSGDDFGRMNQGQIVLVAAAKRMLNPLVWPRIPAIAAAFSQSVDTNLPVWQWPRLALALARAGSNGIDQRTLTREMTTPFTTDQGAQVLAPNWDLIRPMIAEMFAP